jgi:hypothetical protein
MQPAPLHRGHPREKRKKHGGDLGVGMRHFAEAYLSGAGLHRLNAVLTQRLKPPGDNP